MSDDARERALAALERMAPQVVPKILSHGCRDPGAPAYGCFDRDWWHYKIRDFPSIILQQAGYAAWEARALPAFAREAAGLSALAAASARFWQDRALRAGAFEEYYPWENGYPPLAFSTLAVMKLAAGGALPVEALRRGAEIAAAQLLARFEERAANQQVAGLAALAWLKRCFPALVPDAAFEALSRRTLALQHAEGWFVEYDGPDLGYLSVTLDALWDLFDATGDARFLEASRRALGFLAEVVAFSRGGIGVHNARNSDYILPYGLLRHALHDRGSGGVALSAFATLYQDLDAPWHFARAIDDRYLCHYAGASLVRAATLIPALRAAAPAVSPARPTGRGFEGSGYVLAEQGDLRLMISLRKGGVLSGRMGAARFADLGWIVEDQGKTLVSHWWSPLWEIDLERWRVRGALFPRSWTRSTPPRHAALRVASRLVGRRLITGLKDRMIFQTQTSSVRLERSARLVPDGVEVVDRFEGLPEGAALRRAPRASSRHVASADSAHPEDFTLLDGFEREEQRSREGPRLVLITRYRLREARP